MFSALADLTISSFGVDMERSIPRVHAPIGELHKAITDENTRVQLDEPIAVPRSTFLLAC